MLQSVHLYNHAFFLFSLVDKTFDELKNSFDAFLQQQSKKLINHCFFLHNVHYIWLCIIHFTKTQHLESEESKTTNQGIITLACLPEMCYSY